MLKYGIPDLRPFFESDIRWLRHYGFSPLAPTMFHFRSAAKRTNFDAPYRIALHRLSYATLSLRVRR